MIYGRSVCFFCFLLSTDTKRERKLFLWQILFTGLKAVETNPVYANNLSKKCALHVCILFECFNIQFICL